MYIVNNIKIEYDDLIILDNTSLKFERGKFYTILGESGIGKSSLINKIGLISPFSDREEYILDNKIIDTSNNKEVSDFIYNEIAFIFQKQNLIRDINVYENLAIILRNISSDEDTINKRIDQVLKELNIEKLKYKFPEDLSGGEEQRVAIARALVSDKSIILADEPTNSLDSKNSKIVYNLLSELAHKYNKIVIMVTHDERLLDKSDFIIRFVNKKLVFESINNDSVINNENNDANKLTNNSGRSDISSNKNNLVLKKRKAPLPKFFIFIIAIVVSISVLSININRLFNDRYENLVKNSLENGFFVIYDNLGIKSKKVIDDFQSIPDNIMSEVLTSNNNITIEPYIEFVSFGMTLENAKNYSEIINSFQPNITIDSQTFNLDKPYTIQPLYGTNITERSIEYFNRDEKSGIFISEEFISENKLNSLTPETIISIDYYVPVKLYDIDITMEDKDIKGDEDLYIKQSKDFKIAGIIKSDYPFDYSSNGNTLFLNIEEMKKIQDNLIKGVSAINTLDGYDVFDWKTNSFHIKMDDNLKIPDEINRIESISEKFSVVSSYDQYEEFEQSLSYIQKLLFAVSGVLMILIISLLFFVFFLLNSSRKLEVGILKALGFRTQTILKMYLKELLLYGKNIFVISMIINIIIAIIITNLLNLKFNNSLNFVLISVIWTIILSNLTILFSGLFPIYKACKETIIDTIRLNK